MLLKDSRHSLLWLARGEWPAMHVCTGVSAVRVTRESHAPRATNGDAGQTSVCGAAAWVDLDVGQRQSDQQQRALEINAVECATAKTLDKSIKKLGVLASSSLREDAPH